MSDTDAFNRAAGFGFKFEERPGPDGRLVRIGQVTRLGLTLRWDELPWEWEAPNGFRLERRFHGGPVEKIVAEARLDTIEGGTRIWYTVSMFPANWLLRPAVQIDASTSTRPQLERAFAAVRKSIADGDPVEPGPPPLAPEAAVRLDALVERLGTPAARAIRDRILRAPLREQLRIRPRAVAPLYQLDSDAFVLGCLDAVSAGLLELRFELLCPSCLGPKQTVADAPGKPVGVHCPSCNIDYDGSYPDSVDAVFRPATWLRPDDAPTDCAIGPGRTPHVLLRRSLAGGSETELVLRLEPGSYRLHTGGKAASAVIEVGDGAGSATVAVGHDGIQPPALRIGTEARLTVRSRLSEPATLLLEKRWRPAGVLSAGELWAIPGAAERLSGLGRLAPGAEQVRGGVIAVDGPSVRRIVDRLRTLARAVVTNNDRAVAVFSTATQAADVAVALAERDLGVGLASGLVWLGEESITGAAASEALAVLRGAGLGRVAARKAALDDPELAAALGRYPQKATATGLVRIDVPKRPPVVDRRKVQADAQLIGGMWRLGEQIGAGGCGVVHAATGTDGRSVAIKLLLPSVADDVDAMQRFYDEARLVGRFSGRHVVRVYDYGQSADGQLYIVMERLSGPSLAAEIKEGPIPIDRAVAAAQAILDALDEAHGRGIVHRDVKPGNAIRAARDADAPVKLIDFGIAAPADLAEHLTESLGTPLYMAPEQLESGAYSPASDIYAVGLVLYELLTGTTPWAGSGRGAVTRRMVDDPPPVRDLRPEVPEVLAAAIHKALAREPAERFGSVAEMRAAISC